MDGREFGEDEVLEVLKDLNGDKRWVYASFLYNLLGGY